MKNEPRTRMSAYLSALAAVALLLGTSARSIVCQPTGNRAHTDDQACPALVQQRVVSDKLGRVIGKEFRLSVEDHEALLFLPDEMSPRESGNWIWFAPMVPHEPNDHHSFIIQHVLSAGMAFAAINVGESYGNPQGTQAYAEFHDVLNRCFKLSRRAVLLPQSRGGLMLFNWAALHPDEVERIAGIYPVCDLRSYPGIVTAAAAYRMTVQEMGVQLEQHNPIDLLSRLASAHVPIFILHGDNDKVVPIQENSAELVRSYRKLGGSAKLVIVPGRGHEEVNEFFQSQRFVQFLITGK